MTKCYCYKKFKGYNKLSKRFKRRNRHIRYTCKAEQRFCLFMDKFYGKSNLYTIDIVIKQLLPCLSWLKRQYENVYTKRYDYVNNYKSGFDTYGYDNVLNDLDYISDRWRCDWRIRWIINLLDKEYNYNG